MADDAYHSDDEERDDDIYTSAALQILNTNNNGIFRPMLADTQKIGFFSQDRTTQTEESEIIDLKQMTEVIQQLLKDTDDMRRDIHFARNVMQADFEAKLQEKALDLYCRVNDKISELEKIHQERVGTVRRAFKQQLADAISRMHTYYTNQGRDMDSKMKREKRRKEAEAGRQQEKVREMQATIQRNESIILMLKEQLAQYQKQEEEAAMQSPAISPTILAEIEDLKDDKAKLEDMVKKLEQSVDLHEENTKGLNKEIESLTDQLEKERVFTQQLRQERDEILASQEQEQASSRRSMENQKLKLEKEMQDRLRKAREEALEEAKKNTELLQDAERDKLRKAMEEKRQVEALLAKERAKANEKSQDAIDLEKAKRNEERLANEIIKLKKEIERIHKTWEKKFAILQQSLHALKDESYLRQTLQRQAATLHQASISYAYDSPMGIAPSKPPSNAAPMPSKKPLPEINRQAKGSAADYISYTVSAPSGRATGLTTLADENQIMSDNEQDLPPDVVPLPSPPPRNMTECGDQEQESRPSTRSHVIVLPSVQAQ